MISFAYPFFFSFLLIIFTLQSVSKKLSAIDIRGCRPTLILFLVSVIITAVPFRGLSLARWVFSINGNFCIPLTAMLFSKVFENASGIKLLDRKAALSGWIFGLVAGILLYPMALGLGRFDPYEFGWSFSLLFVILIVITLLMILMKNSFSVVLAACILSYDINVLESHNLWDYIVDPVFMIISGICLTNLLIKQMSKKQTVGQAKDSYNGKTATWRQFTAAKSK